MAALMFASLHQVSDIIAGCGIAMTLARGDPEADIVLREWARHLGALAVAAPDPVVAGGLAHVARLVAETVEVRAADHDATLIGSGTA